jgi:ABC-type Fe3+/spermidine/putrescine transport system ATPase subunit
MPEIILEDLVKDYGNERPAANHLSLTVHDGEYLCLLGPTGAGKTTALRMICGLTRPDSGRILFDGKDVKDIPINERQATMLSQMYSLFPPKTVYDNVMFSPKIKEWPDEDSKQVVKSMLKMVHMEHKSGWYPAALSGGQQQRTALARALASDSKILLLDEPLRALDARLRLELRKELKSMVKEMGLTSIHVTHDQDEALEVADRIAIIRKGRIVQVGTPMEVFKNPRTPFVANFVGRSNVFTGMLESSTPRCSVIRMDNGTTIKARPTDIEVGTKVVVTVKIGSTVPDEIVQNASPDAQAGYFTGTVERVLYEGATITIETSVSGIGTVISQRSSKRFDDYRSGMGVNITWPPEQASVFRIPEEGLEEELRLG